MKIDKQLTVSDLATDLERLWELSGEKLNRMEKEYDESQGSPVFTRDGRYTTRGWTEWTQGFHYGSDILQFDASGDRTFLERGRSRTLERMAPHVTHIGVHDHGFNNVSTYGSLLRLMGEGKIEEQAWERAFYELALKASGAVQASRWTETSEGFGFIHSFNGPHSLFVDTIRTVRALALSHRLGHSLMAENDQAISLLGRLLEHARATAAYNIYYGEGRDAYDLSGRTAHEAVFNRTDGQYRCPNSQQGYSPFSTWTRGLAWAMCGYPEELEFLDTLDKAELESWGGIDTIREWMVKAARSTCNFYIDHTSLDGIPYWDTGAPELHRLGRYQEEIANPYNEFEPVDASAAAIGAQGLLRLGHWLRTVGNNADGDRYVQAGLTVSRTLLQEPYLSTDPNHNGLLLHSVYHRPNGWDHIPEGAAVPAGESSMWGDYHLRELALYLTRLLREEPYYTFFHTIGEDA
ncbi:MAG: glycosyl hydrolase [Bacteroidota bacterium]